MFQKGLLYSKVKRPSVTKRRNVQTEIKTIFENKLMYLKEKVIKEVKQVLKNIFCT